MPKKNQSPFDFINMMKKNNKNFGFNIESSFVDGPSNKQKMNKLKLKKYHDVRYQQRKSGSTEDFTPSEERNIYGIYRFE